MMWDIYLSTFKSHHDICGNFFYKSEIKMSYMYSAIYMYSAVYRKKLRDSKFGNASVFHWYDSGKSMEDQ